MLSGRFLVFCPFVQTVSIRLQKKNNHRVHLTRMEKYSTLYPSIPRMELNNDSLKVPKNIPTTPQKSPNTRGMISHIPLILTWIRIGVIPLFVFAFYLPIAHSSIVCLSIFLFASFSDYLDGYLARKWNCTSSLGSFLDPVADKLLVTIALILLSSTYRGGILLPICTCIIVSREIFVSAWREWMTALGKRERVAVGIWGKLKTTLQMTSISLFLIDRTFPIFGLLLASQITCVVATVLSVYSALSYVQTKPSFVIGE
ncbi:hypothetical protein GpartN1_g897.t1 [Galdieria partita]|uniref:CDP-diacylglycerol--glycerol-3-phosphate 3-phosphatidyltransferase n=1 Tax=Galdieria partita TaxID=83374 RepID=A0A9C7PSP3_9RHOD|nr:hypothetical protein GpartN1_g897.t1 [Galdieria partita]